MTQGVLLPETIGPGCQAGKEVIYSPQGWHRRAPRIPPLTYLKAIHYVMAGIAVPRHL